MDRVRKALSGWMRDVMAERRWTAAAWARLAEVTPTNITRFLKDPATASLPSADTIGRLALAAGREPRFLEEPAFPSAARVPVLEAQAAKELLALPERDGMAFLEKLLRGGTPTVPADPVPSPRAFAMRITSLHMNAGGWLPQDHVVVEPADTVPARNGDMVVVLDGEEACGYRYYPPLLVPVSTDSSCCPMLYDGASVAGVAVQLVRALRA
ncbi:XRE family transcriptional regulator [Aerophototrophica crusticola]|uniref:XRE family transcriptional regulator n=1 Tax=Aerophototrophica crusticola TaxID=1709002 RepID=A0A858R6E7_9PROT|nr:XRE family transcriptional regulator [Rhodospirillaceae bacterium B3]